MSLESFKELAEQIEVGTGAANVSAGLAMYETPRQKNETV